MGRGLKNAVGIHKLKQVEIQRSVRRLKDPVVTRFTPHAKTSGRQEKNGLESRDRSSGAPAVGHLDAGCKILQTLSNPRKRKLVAVCFELKLDLFLVSLKVPKLPW